jgi:hypothetical protein
MIELDAAARLLRYNEQTGDFVWISPPKNHPRMLGKEAGCNASGYTMISLLGKKVKAHRLAWLFAYGAWPDMEVDHINGNPFDNRIENLRLATNPQNQANRKRNAGKATPKGVRQMKSGRFQARLRVDGKAIHIGSFDTSELASQAYMAAAKKYYGEFARGA